jgi:hypothetical protein
MGIHFKEFCDQQRKDKNGHVPYILDMTEAAQDKAVIAYFKDNGQGAIAAHFQLMSKKRKDETYSSVEHVIKDMIEKYNLGVDIAKEAKAGTEYSQ